MYKRQLLNSSHQVPGPTRRKILELEREGVPFVLVSARMPEGMTTIQAMIGCRAPMVCYSGALVRDEDGKTMYSCQMDLDLAVRIKDLIGKEFPEICCNTYGGSRWVVDDDSSPWVRKEEEITGLKAMNGDIREVFAADRGVHKFLLMGQEKAVQGPVSYTHLDVYKRQSKGSTVHRPPLRCHRATARNGLRD